MAANSPVDSEEKDEMPTPLRLLILEDRPTDAELMVAQLVDAANFVWSPSFARARRSIVAVTSTAWVAVGAAFTAAHRTPDHGSSPSSSSSRKTHRFPASRAASSAAMPTARWSAMFIGPKLQRCA